MKPQWAAEKRLTFWRGNSERRSVKAKKTEEAAIVRGEPFEHFQAALLKAESRAA